MKRQYYLILKILSKCTNMYVTQILGKWKFYADSDLHAMQFALFYCRRGGEDFVKVESCTFSKQKSLYYILLTIKTLYKPFKGFWTMKTVVTE